MNFKYVKQDILAGFVVFFVALPLCLGIALASGAPLFAGVIAGVVGGIVVGLLSGSQVGVSGPAAGLTVIVLSAIAGIGSYQDFLMAVVLAGAFQIIFAKLGAGKMAFFFPSSVINGMLVAIGIIIFLKQLVHAFGIDKDYEGDFSFFQADGENTFTELLNVFNFMNPWALFVSSVCLLILIVWQQDFMKKLKWLTSIPSALICVIFSIVFVTFFPDKISQEHLVSLPISNTAQDFLSFFTLPNFKALSLPIVWQTALIISVIASVETLLCVEATDKLDADSRITPTNQELMAQGVGNMVSGLIGGIPITQVVVRSTANLNAGVKTKMGAVYHGMFLIVCVLFIPTVLNKIPYSALAAILIMTGYKLAKPSIFVKMYKEGFNQFVPFIVTVVAIVATDLMKGIGIGMVVGLGFVLYTNFKSSVSFTKNGNNKMIKIRKDVFFFNRAKVMGYLSEIVSGDNLYIDASQADFIDYDIYKSVKEFKLNASKIGVTVELKGFETSKLK